MPGKKIDSKTNLLAILALVFAFLIPIVGIGLGATLG